MKKVLLLFLCVSIIVMSIPFTAIASSVTVPEITSYGFMTVDGKVITTLGGETSVKAYVDIDNINHITSNNLGNLVACCYVDGAVVSTTTLPITIDANTYLKRMETNEINVPIGSTNVVFKVFIMDSLQNIRPVVNMYRWGTNPNAVNDGTKYADAIKTVTGLGIMNGYEDGSFRAEGNLTRAEFAAIMIRLLGKESLAQNAIGSTPFSDVSELNWASGYINIVAPLDFMSGYSDNRFGPDNNITLEQGIKGFVTTLGYAPTVGVLGYPLGYLDKANGLGITKDISILGKDIVSRGVLAKLIANSLEVPLCENNIVQDGYNNTVRKTIISEYRNLVKLQVVVNEYTGFTSDTNNVHVTILNNYKTKYSSDFPVGTNCTLDAGTSNISELVGRRAIVYVAYDEYSSSAPVVISAIKDTTKTNEFSVLSDDIVNVVTLNGITTVEYWANETDAKTTKITLPATATYYVNGSLTAYPPSLMDVYGSISFAKNDTYSPEDFDTVFITNYTNYVVDKVNIYTFRVISKNAGSISFDPVDTTVKSILYDINGKQINWADLKENDIISCKVVNGNKKVTVGTLVNNKINGMIVEVDSSSITNTKYTIGNKVYKIDMANMSNALALADKGTFYLDILGNICWFVAGAITPTPTPTPNPVQLPTETFAMITGTSTGTNVDGDTIVKLKTLQDGSTTILNGDVNFASFPSIGTAVIPAKNDRGEVTLYRTFAVPNDSTNTAEFTIPLYYASDINFIYGRVKERIANTISTANSEFVVPLTANVYVYDERANSTNRVSIGDITNFNAQLFNNITTYDPDVASIYTLAREYNGKIIDVMVYIFK